MRALAGLLLWVAVSLEVGCFPTRLCGEVRDPVVLPDGGNQACVVAETCARPENLGLCLTTGLPESPCVECENEHCVIASPVRCD